MPIPANAFTKAIVRGMILAALALAAPISATAQSGLRPGEPAAIVAAAQSCREAVTPARLDEQRLTADGWTLAQMSQEGRPVESPLRMFGRGSIMLVAMPESPGCLVMARLESAARYAELIQALISAFGAPARTQSGQTLWLLEGNRAMQAETTGSRERPGVRIAIMYVGGSAQ